MTRMTCGCFSSSRSTARIAVWVVGEAASGDEALTLQQELDLDVVVLDQRMPGLTGLETAKAMLAEDPDLPIVLYSAFADDTLADSARQIGVRACVRKGDTRSLISALRELTGLDISDPVS